jgi:hypothetical protein
LLKSKLYRILLISFGFVLIQSCSELPTGVKTNQPPETYLSLFPDSIISPQKTRIKISWWGDDPDGIVAGYYFSFDSLNWTFTTHNDSTFQLAINGLDSTFRFWVAAVDNKGLRDPTPASNRYPVVNSPPSVSFNTGTDIPDTTFTVASFAWTGTDPDGDNTVRYYYWALNDTSNWHRIPSSMTTITLRQDSGIVPNSRNILYLKAQDNAGSYSPIVRMPDTNKTWYARAPVGNFLLISDYFKTTPTDLQSALTFYNAVFGNTSYSILDIKVNNGGNIPKIVNPMFIETLKLFRCVVWFSWRGNNTNDNTNFDLAQGSIPYYMLAGGKVLFTTGFIDPLPSPLVANFASIDSVSYNEFSGFPSPSIQPYPVIVIDNAYDTLFTGSPIPQTFNLDRVRILYPNASTHTIYKLADPNNPNQSGVVCIKDTDQNPRIVFMSVALHRMNYNGRAVNFFRHVTQVDFGIR